MLPFKKNADSEEKRNPPSPEEMYARLRNQALGVTPEALDLQPRPDEAYGVLMELGMPRATVTLVAMGEGAVSIYFSTGGGVIGAGQHEKARKAGLAFVNAAAGFIQFMSTTRDFPLPQPDHVRFYVLMPDAIYTSETSQQDLVNSQNPLSALFSYANSTMTELRLAETGQQR